MTGSQRFCKNPARLRAEFARNQDPMGHVARELLPPAMQQRRVEDSWFVQIILDHYVRAFPELSFLYRDRSDASPSPPTRAATRAARSTDTCSESSDVLP